MADNSITTSQIGITEIENFDLHDPRTLRAFADRYIKPKSFLKDFFFPTTPADMFSTESILLDDMKRGRKMAPFVISGSKDVARNGFVTDEYKPPRIAPSRTTRVDDLKKRGFGEQIFNSNGKPNLRATRMTVQDMSDMSDMITRREEAMCAEVLINNACVMKHIDPNSDNTETHTLKFYSGEANDQVYTPAKSWGTADADILGDVYAMRKIIREKGNPADILLVSSDVADAIMNNTQIAKQLDNRRIEIGSIKPLELGNGATEICKLNVKGSWVTVVMYDETYENDEGEDTPYLPNGTAILTAKGCGRGYYGGVTQLEHSSDEFQHYEGRRVPKLIKDVNNDEKKLQLVARPIMAPVTKFGWISAKAIF
jgi:hypothetical protein